MAVMAAASLRMVATAVQVAVGVKMVAPEEREVLQEIGRLWEATVLLGLLEQQI